MMKRTAIAVLILFIASLLGGTFAAGCMAAPRMSQPGVHMQVLPCCAVKAACAGGSCYASAHMTGCMSDAGTFAVAQKVDAASIIIKLPPPIIVPVVSLTTIASIDLPLPPARARVHADIAGYADVYARTGRLLI